MKICHKEKQEREYGLETLKVSAKQFTIPSLPNLKYKMEKEK